MYCSFFLHTLENIDERSLHVQRKKKIGLLHAFVFDYLHVFVHVRELVNILFLFPFTLVAGNIDHMHNIKNVVYIFLFD
jgi:hypothetical protein